MCLKKYISSNLAGSKVIPSNKPQSRASYRVADSAWLLVSREGETASRAILSVYLNLVLGYPSLKRGARYSIKRIGKTREP